MSKKILKDLNGINIKIPNVEPPTYYKISRHIYKVSNMLPNEYISVTFLGSEQKSTSGYLISNDIDLNNEDIKTFLESLPDYISTETNNINVKKIISLPPITATSKATPLEDLTIGNFTPTPEDAVIKISCSPFQFIGGED